MFPVLWYLHGVCILAFDQCLHFSLNGVYQILCYWETSPFVQSLREPCLAKMKPVSSRSWTGFKSSLWAYNLGYCYDISQISHKSCSVHRTHPCSVAGNSSQEHRTSWCNCLHHCFADVEHSAWSRRQRVRTLPMQTCSMNHVHSREAATGCWTHENLSPSACVKKNHCWNKPPGQSNLSVDLITWLSLWSSHSAWQRGVNKQKQKMSKSWMRFALHSSNNQKWWLDDFDNPTLNQKMWWECAQCVKMSLKDETQHKCALVFCSTCSVVQSVCCEMKWGRPSRPSPRNRWWRNSTKKTLPKMTMSKMT